jgi:hypothetical protein
MDLGSIFLILAVFILTVLFIVRPFFEHKTVSVSRQEIELSSLLAERDRILNALEELDFDYSMKKIAEDVYPIQRAVLLKRGAEVLRKLEEASWVQGEAATQKARARLQTAVAGNSGTEAVPEPSLRANHSGNGSGSTGEDDDLERLIASRRRARQEKTSGFCPQCGGALQKSDLFCPKCGSATGG